MDKVAVGIMLDPLQPLELSAISVDEERLKTQVERIQSLVLPGRPMPDIHHLEPGKKIAVNGISFRNEWSDIVSISVGCDFKFEWEDTLDQEQVVVANCTRVIAMKAVRRESVTYRITGNNVPFAVLMSSEPRLGDFESPPDSPRGSWV